MAEITIKEKPNPLNPYEMTAQQRLKQIEEENKEQENLHMKGPFSKWAMLNMDQETQEAFLSMPAMAYKVFTFLMFNIDKKNALIVSYSTMCEMLNISRQSAVNAIKYLEENKYIKIAKSGNSNIYYVNSRIIWKTYGSNVKYSEFDCKVIISKKEQEQRNIKTTFTKKMEL